MTEYEALKLARMQLLTRVVQLSSCRVCGAQQAEHESALKTIDQMIREREHVVQPGAAE